MNSGDIDVLRISKLNNQIEINGFDLKLLEAFSSLKEFMPFNMLLSLLNAVLVAPWKDRVSMDKFRPVALILILNEPPKASN